MKVSIILLVSAMLGVIGGAALIGRWAIGLALIADSIALAGIALMRDDGRRPEVQPSVTSLEDVLERARRSS